MKKLTRRHIEIAERVGKGMTDKEIAGDLGLSVLTVRTYVRNAGKRIPGEGWPKHKLLLWFLNIKED